MASDLRRHAFPLNSRTQRQNTPMLVSLETDFYVTLMCLLVLETKVTVIQESSTSLLQARCSVFRMIIVLFFYFGQVKQRCGDVKVELDQCLGQPDFFFVIP